MPRCRLEAAGPLLGVRVPEAGWRLVMAKVDIARVADVIREVAVAEIMPRWRNLSAGDIASKAASGSLVTIADHAAEAALTTQLAALLPGSIVIGEEAVAADPGVLERFGSAEPVWVIDPIDGTRKFTEGKTSFDVMVVLMQGGRGIAAWIYAPAEGKLYMGEVGAGVVRIADGQAAERITARPGRSLSELTGILTSRGFLNRGLPDPENVRHRFRQYAPPICAGHNYSRILDGECDFLIGFATLPWDHLPGLMLAGEAGFHHARHDGRPFAPLDSKGGLLIAPDEASWRDILAALLP